MYSKNGAKMSNKNLNKCQTEINSIKSNVKMGNQFKIYIGIRQCIYLIFRKMRGAGILVYNRRHSSQHRTLF